ncbi:MAG: DUF748 domain-containing protein [Candidatus Omnitrophota bacterium]
MKKFLLILLAVFVSTVTVVYIFRYDIFQYSAETIIKKKLPDYVSVDRLIFDLKNNLLEIKTLKIKNPEGFHFKYMAQMDSITCKYRAAGQKILDGIEITEVTASGPVIYLERAASGRVNANEMGQVMSVPGRRERGTLSGEIDTVPVLEKPKAVKGEFSRKSLTKKNISDLVKLTNTITIKNGKIVFSDSFVSSSPHVMMFERLNGDLVLDLSRDYSSARSIRSTGTGFINGRDNQKIEWAIFFDPTKKALTMSSEYKIENVDIRLFEPYYDSYSPITIHKGTCSGTLVFNFDNGNIGSTNTLRIKGLDFSLKNSDVFSNYWDSSLPEIIKYLKDASEEIVFDFKIKGDINSPKFYPGPELKKAVQNLVINKIQGMVESFNGDDSGEGNVGKVIDLVRGLIR